MSSSVPARSSSPNGRPMTKQQTALGRPPLSSSGTGGHRQGSPTSRGGSGVGVTGKGIVLPELQQPGSTALRSLMNPKAVNGEPMNAQAVSESRMGQTGATGAISTLAYKLTALSASLSDRMKRFAEEELERERFSELQRGEPEQVETGAEIERRREEEFQDESLAHGIDYELLKKLKTIFDGVLPDLNMPDQEDEDQPGQYISGVVRAARAEEARSRESLLQAPPSQSSLQSWQSRAHGELDMSSAVSGERRRSLVSNLSGSSAGRPSGGRYLENAGGDHTPVEGRMTRRRPTIGVGGEMREGGAGKQAGIDETDFIKIFGPKLCPGMSTEEMLVWSRGMDANCSGRISWEELSGFLSTSAAIEAASTRTSSKVKALEERPVEPIKPNKYRGHNKIISRICYAPSCDRFLTGGHDGVVRQWTSSTLQMLEKPVHRGSDWIAGLMAVPNSSRILVMQSSYVFFQYNAVTRVQEDGNNGAAAKKKRREGDGEEEEDDDGEHGRSALREKSIELSRVYGVDGGGGSGCVSEAPSKNGSYLYYPNLNQPKFGSSGVVPRNGARSSMPCTIVKPVTHAPALCADHYSTGNTGTENILVGSEDGKCALYQLHQNDKPVTAQWSSQLHRGWCTWIRGMPEQDSVITSGMDGTVLITNIEKNLTVSSLVQPATGSPPSPTHDPSTSGAAFVGRRPHSPGERAGVFQFDYDPYLKWVGYGHGRSAWIWSAVTGAKIAQLKDCDSPIVQTAFGANQNLFFGLSHDRSLKIWDIRTWTVLETIVDSNPFEDTAECIFWSAKQKGLLVGARDVVMWRTTGATASHGPLGPTNVSRRGDKSAGKGSETKAVTGSGTPLPGPVGERRPSRGLNTPSSAHSVVGDHLPGHSRQGTRQGMNSNNTPHGGGDSEGGGGAAPSPFGSESETMIALMFAPRSRYVVVVYRTKVVLWSAETFSFIWAWRWHHYPQVPTAATLTVDERRLLVGTDKGEVLLLNVCSGALVRRLAWNRTMITASHHGTTSAAQHPLRTLGANGPDATSFLDPAQAGTTTIHSSSTRGPTTEISALCFVPLANSLSMGISIASSQYKVLAWHDLDPVQAALIDAVVDLGAPDSIATVKEEYGTVQGLYSASTDVGICFLVTANGTLLVQNAINLATLTVVHPARGLPRLLSSTKRADSMASVLGRSVLGSRRRLLSDSRSSPRSGGPGGGAAKEAQSGGGLGGVGMDSLSVESLICLHPGIFLCALADGRVRIFSRDRDNVVMGVATFFGASTQNDVVTCGAVVPSRHALVLGDSDGSISTFKAPKLLNPKECKHRILPGLANGKLTEQSISDSFITFGQAWKAHRGVILDVVFHTPNSTAAANPAPPEEAGILAAGAAAGRMIISSGSDGRIRLWDIHTKALLCDFGRDILSLPPDDPSFTQLEPSAHPFNSVPSVAPTPTVVVPAQLPAPTTNPPQSPLVPVAEGHPAQLGRQRFSVSVTSGHSAVEAPAGLFASKRGSLFGAESTTFDSQGPAHGVPSGRRGSQLSVSSEGSSSLAETGTDLVSTGLPPLSIAVRPSAALGGERRRSTAHPTKLSSDSNDAGGGGAPNVLQGQFSTDSFGFQSFSQSFFSPSSKVPWGGGGGDATDSPRILQMMSSSQRPGVGGGALGRPPTASSSAPSVTLNLQQQQAYFDGLAARLQAAKPIRVTESRRRDRDRDALLLRSKTTSPTRTTSRHGLEEESSVFSPTHGLPQQQGYQVTLSEPAKSMWQLGEIDRIRERRSNGGGTDTLDTSTACRFRELHLAPLPFLDKQLKSTASTPSSRSGGGSNGSLGVSVKKKK